uniref:Uncharacterized protein n=1 Tax=Tenebrio molitor TaxID=7067 RepID=A0A8J6L715_TENMO|nr:hypothetical protein GEV33_014523 [Tenebrio molitor]
MSVDVRNLETEEYLGGNFLGSTAVQNNKLFNKLVCWLALRVTKRSVTRLNFANPSSYLWHGGTAEWPGDAVDRLRQVFYQLGTETEQDRRVGSPVGSPSKGCCSGDTSCSKEGVLGWITTHHDGIKVTCTPMMHCWRCDERHFLGGDETPLVWVSMRSELSQDGRRDRIRVHFCRFVINASKIESQGRRWVPNGEMTTR